MGVLKLFEGTGEMECVVATIRTPEGMLQKVIDGTSFSIGRAPDCVLSIPHAGISRLHVLVTVKRGEVYLMDQESSNGTFINGTKIEPKRLTHIKPTDEIKLGLSDVLMQFSVLEKHFKTDYIAESLLPSHEKDNLMALIKASNHKAQEIISSAQVQADHITQVSNEKARNLENQTLLKQEEIISSAQVEGQHFISDSKRKAAQILLENEDKVKESCQSIYDQAERIRKEAEIYFQNRVKDAETRGTEIIDQHTKLAQELVEDLKEKTAKKVEADIRNQLAYIVKETEIKFKYLSELKTECSDYEENKRNEIEAELKSLKADLHAQFEKEKAENLTFLQDKITTLENEYNDKKASFDSELSSKSSELEKEYSEKAQNLASDFSTKTSYMEEQYAQRVVELQRNFENLNQELERNLKQTQNEAAATILKQRQMLDSEIQLQRQQLVEVNSELGAMQLKAADVKGQYDNIQGLLQGLQNSEAVLIGSLNEKRELIKNAATELQSIKADIDSQQEKFLFAKSSGEAQMEDYQLRLGKLKAAFEAESERLKKESEQEIATYKEEFKNLKEQMEQQFKLEKSEIHRKTMDYMDSERARMDEYRAQMLQEKKDLDHTFDRTRKEFESKTKEAIDLERQKIEEARQTFITSLSRERQVITDDVTISIMKMKNHESLTASAVSDAVARVFNSHVTSHSVDSTIKASAQNITQMKVKFMGYGLGIAMAVLLAFKLIIQPQINRNIAGTAEHQIAQTPVERPKYVPEKTLEFKETYTDAVLFTSKYPEIYLDEQLHDKWFKHISGYMYENWRVDETKSIEAISISKTLVKNLWDTSNNLDAEFHVKGIEKMRELEVTSEKRIMDILGTKVKYEAYRRKEREFFEPYIQNQ